MCSAPPVLRTVSVSVPAGRRVTDVGLKKKSAASMDTAEPLAAMAPWSLAGVGSGAELGQVPADRAGTGRISAPSAQFCEAVELTHEGRVDA